jgi:hypothetical protein
MASSAKASNGTVKSRPYDACRGRIPSIQASRLRAMALEAFHDKEKILATACADDALTARLVEEAGFPCIFLGGYMVSSSLGLPDTVSFREHSLCA